MTPEKLNIAEIIRKIEQGQLFEASPLEGGFVIKISKYVPYCCTAIHDGSQLRKELKKKIALTEYERWYEEDPHTADFIDSMPITIVGLDSRFEYDLNRTPETCIYDQAWGKTVWKKSLSTAEKKLSQQKHRNYFKVLHALITKLENLFGGSILYDIHSYNFQRWDRDVPLFNVGTERINHQKFGLTVQNWLQELSTITLPDILNTTKENDVFYGRGYNLEYVTTRFENTLVLATEVKKVYCDELTGDTFPKVVKQLQRKMKQAILNNTGFFTQNLQKWHHEALPHLLDKTISPELLDTDEQLFLLLRDFELLAYVNPINSGNEKKKFFKNKFTQFPNFKYSPIKVNPYQMKQTLMSLPINKIQDISIRTLYESVVTAYMDKIDLLASLGTQKFLFNSLRYFGRPSKQDISNANYLLLLPDIPSEKKREPVFSARQTAEIFRQALDKANIKARVELSNKVISQVMVLNSKRSILIQPEAKFRKKELHAMIAHEIGVHMFTTINSSNQKLKVLNIGLPVNTRTQEGLAILSEYLSGNMTLNRLKSIALRVIAVDMMANGADFIETFHALTNQFGLDEEEAFKIGTRVYRGGGFTKDYLYLNGFVKIYRMWQRNHDLSPLLTGKTSVGFFNTIEEMICRDMISKPQFIPTSFTDPKPENNNPVYDYILSGLKG